MRKLEKLRIERGVASLLTFLPMQTKQMIDRFYENSIYGIEHYGLDNDPVSPESLVSIRDTVDKWMDISERNERENAN